MTALRRFLTAILLTAIVCVIPHDRKGRQLAEAILDWFGDEC